jgi:hypothetical protein
MIEEQETRQAKKTKCHSKSDPQQQADSKTIAAEAASTAIEAAAAAALQTLSSPPQGSRYDSAIQNTQDSLTGASFPNILLGKQRKRSATLNLIHNNKHIRIQLQQKLPPK